MRIDVTKAALKKGDMVLLEGFPDIPDNWRELRRQAMAINLTCVRDYLREGLTVGQIAERYSVSGSLIRNRVRAGMIFLQNHAWLFHRRTGQTEPDSSSSADTTLSSGPSSPPIPAVRETS